MTRLTFVSIAAAVLVGSSLTAGFVPLSARAAIPTRPSNILKAATFGGDISFDVDRARECADSFGECSIEDMERMKNALHAERIANFLTAKSDPSWPEAELHDRILEEDLGLQLKSLKAYINDPRVENLEMPGQQSAEKLHSDMEMMDHPISVPSTDDVYSATPAAQHTASRCNEYRRFH